MYTLLSTKILTLFRSFSIVEFYIKALIEKREGRKDRETNKERVSKIPDEKIKEREIKEIEIK